MGSEHQAARALLVYITQGSVLLTAVSRGGSSSEGRDRSALGKIRVLWVKPLVE